LGASFEELDIWIEAMNLTIQVYKNIEFMRDFGLRNQLQKSAVSIVSNIAEGSERQTNNEFVRFLFIAKGSCGELRTQLIIAKKLGYINEEISRTLIDKSRKISSMISNFIKARRSFTQSR
jgi:four helix bundle protein